MARPEGLKSEARSAERVEFLEEGMFCCPPARGSGERCNKLPLWGPWRLEKLR